MSAESVFRCGCSTMTSKLTRYEPVCAGLGTERAWCKYNANIQQFATCCPLRMRTGAASALRMDIPDGETVAPIACPSTINNAYMLHRQAPAEGWITFHASSGVPYPCHHRHRHLSTTPLAFGKTLATKSGDVKSTVALAVKTVLLYFQVRHALNDKDHTSTRADRSRGN